jgi:Cd2+/Zn2+-exporting ATPase
LNGHTREELLARAASLESHSSHPIATAITSRAAEEGIDIEPGNEFTITPGKGAKGTYDGKEYWIGSHRFMHEQGVETEACHEATLRLESTGNTVVALGTSDHVCGLVSVSDGIRDQAAAMLSDLDALGIKHTVMLTGDNARTAQAVGAAVGISDIRAELLPEEKVEAVSGLVKLHGTVAMIGDGINDAPAMAMATMGIAMGAAGSDAAIETADVALMSDDLSKIPWLIQHSRRTMQIIKQNVAFALLLKLAFIVMAILGMATLWMAIAADMGASLVVIFNGLRLLRSE